MKWLIALCFVALVGLSLAATTNSRDCYYVLGNSHRQCEEGTHSYTIGFGYKTPEATCNNPNPVPDTSAEVCDYSDCYCDSPTVRDTATNKCVPSEECPKREEQKEMQKDMEKARDGDILSLDYY